VAAGGWMSDARACVCGKIVAGAAPASVVFRDDEVVAFMAASPSAPGHVLVVPRAHYETCFDLDDELAGPLFRMAIRIARAIKQLYQPDGIRLVQNNGPAAGQSVFHVHVHVLPATLGRRTSIDDSGRSADRAELDRLAAEIGAALKDGG